MCIFAVWRGMTQNAYPKTAYGNAEMRTLRLHIKLRTVRGFTNKKSANSLKVSGFLNKKCVHLYAFRGERGIRTPGTSRYDGFQDRCNRPLYHLSEWCGFNSGCKSTKKNTNVQMFLIFFVWAEVRLPENGGWKVVLKGWLSFKTGCFYLRWEGGNISWNGNDMPPEC